MSYSLGVSMGEQLRASYVTPDEVNAERLAQGVRDGLTGKAKLSDADRDSIGKLLRSAHEAAGEVNHRAAAGFLAENAKKPDVVTTASGLQYKVLAAGSGDSPKATDEVTVNYRGTLLDGTEFDSSYKRGQPANFVLNRVIPGWSEGLALMKPGAKYQLWIPPQLAYDLRSPPPIPPGSMLIFEVELVGVKPAPPPAPPPGAAAPAPRAPGSKHRAGPERAPRRPSGPGVSAGTEAHRLGDAEAGQLAQQVAGELRAGGPPEWRCRVPVVRPGLLGAQRQRLIEVTRNDVRVQRRVLIAEDGVVDPRRAGHFQQRIAQARHVGKKDDALARAERVEIRYHRVRQQQRVAAHELPLAEHRPAGEQPRDHAWLASLAGGHHLGVDCGQGCRFSFVLHVAPGERNTKYTAARHERVKEQQQGRGNHRAHSDSFQLTTWRLCKAPSVPW